MFDIAWRLQGGCNFFFAQYIRKCMGSPWTLQLFYLHFYAIHSAVKQLQGIHYLILKGGGISIGQDIAIVEVNKIRIANLFNSLFLEKTKEQF